MIYFIEAVGANLMKIGFTDRHVRDRVRELQTASPHKLRVISVYDGDLQDESDIHDRFSHLRKEGEWFEVTIELMVFAMIGGDMTTFGREFKAVQSQVSWLIDQVQAGYFSSSISDRIQRIESSLERLGDTFSNRNPIPSIPDDRWLGTDEQMEAEEEGLREDEELHQRILSRMSSAIMNNPKTIEQIRRVFVGHPINDTLIDTALSELSPMISVIKGETHYFVTKEKCNF